MTFKHIVLAFAMVWPATVMGQARLGSLEEARSWYVGMMVESGCSMTAREIDAAIEGAFPYSSANGRHSQGLIVDAALDLVARDLVLADGFGRVRYVGPEC